MFNPIRDHSAGGKGACYICGAEFETADAIEVTATSEGTLIVVHRGCRGDEV